MGEKLVKTQKDRFQVDRKNRIGRDKNTPIEFAKRNKISEYFRLIP